MGSDFDCWGMASRHTEAMNPLTLHQVWIDAGSRAETKENNGVAHFLYVGSYLAKS